MLELIIQAVILFVLSPLVWICAPRKVIDAHFTPKRELGKLSSLCLNPQLSLLMFYSLLLAEKLPYTFSYDGQPAMKFAVEVILFFLSCMVWLPFFHRTDELHPASYWNKMIYAVLNGILLVVSLTPILTRKSVTESVQIGAFLMILIQEIVLSILLGVVIFRWFNEEEQANQFRP